MNKVTLTDVLRQQLKSRKSSKNSELLNQEIKPETLIICSPSDIGVIRNGGRQEHFCARSVIINEFQKFQKSSHAIKSIMFQKTTQMSTEIKNFEQLQFEQSDSIHNLLSKNNINLCIHIGGGHDQIFPLLFALQEKYKDEKLNIINIDAHLDTRIDTLPHSGTPFRQFDQSAKREFYLHQMNTKRIKRTRKLYTF